MRLIRTVNEQAARIAELERGETQLCEERDMREEQINQIAVELGMDERERDWSNFNDVGDRCIEWATNLKYERDQLCSELAALRERSGTVLGEPLTYDEWGELPPYTPVLILTNEGDLLPSFGDAIDWHHWKQQWATIHLDPRPLPNLPTPEAVPEVPACINPAGLCGVLIESNEQYVYVTYIASYGQIMGVWADGSVGDVGESHEPYELYTGDVRWPDGTVKPVPATHELLAALKGGE